LIAEAYDMRPCLPHHLLAIALVLLLTDTVGTVGAQLPTAALKIPSCRLDSSNNKIIQPTLKRAIDAYAAIGKPLAIGSIAMNPASPSTDGKTLDVYVAIDAAKGGTDAAGCATRVPSDTDPIDPISVRGGCVITAVEHMELRCSSSAIDIFAKAGRGQPRESIALLYVLSHELGHLYQKRLGEYAGRVERIDAGQPSAAKLETLRASCDPVSTKMEEEADARSFEILVKLVGGPPYRDPILSERGSVYSNIDQLALAADGWQKLNARRDFISQPPVHKSFEPTEFPTPAAKIERNAKSFVCDVLKGKKGNISYPGRSVSHPPMEQRLRRMAEQLKPVADKLPTKPGDPNFTPVAVVYGDLGQILTFMYHETGVYFEALQQRICTRVNGPQPEAGCE
jgi:hypothetical protein